jgi:hypothetical protein
MFLIISSMIEETNNYKIKIQININQFIGEECLSGIAGGQCDQADEQECALY